MSERRNELTPVGSLLKGFQQLKPLSATKLRVIEAGEQLDPQEILYQHTVFCQTGLPYRDPGSSVREWERSNGNVSLKVLAGEAKHPISEVWVKVGIPFGTKPRLILGDINTEAIITQNPTIDLEKSLTRFVKRMNLDLHGRNIRAVKEAFTRLCAASMRMGLVHDGHAHTVNAHIMSHFEIWFPKDARQRVLWPSTARLSLDYFEILQAHAVPLDQNAYFALSHSALAMDVYAWLAQRLHRIRAAEHLVTWPNLHLQFGWHYKRLVDFRRAFKVALGQVRTVYPAAKFNADESGLHLRCSSPPVLKTQILIP